MRGIYLIKLTIACLLIAIFCGGVSAIYYYIERNQLIQHELEAKQINLLEQVRDKIDLQLVNAINSVFTLKSTTEMINYERSNGEDGYINTRLYSVLRPHIAIVSKMGYTVDIIKLGADTVITGDRTLDMKRYMAMQGLDRESVLSELQDIKESPYLSVYNLQKLKQQDSAAWRDTVTLAFTLKEGNHGDVIYIVTFDTKELLPRNDESYAIAIGDEQLIGSAGPLDASLQNASHYTAQSTKMKNWKVYYFPQSVSAGADQQIWLKTILVALITIVLGALFALLMAFMTYRPVRRTLREMVSNLTPGHIELPKSKDEFGLIQSITNTFRHDNQQLSNELKRNREPLRAKLFRDVVSGVLSKEEALKQLKALHLDPLLGIPLCVLLLHVTDECGETLVDQEAVKGIEELFRTHIGSESTGEFMKLDANRHVLLLFHPGDVDLIDKLQAIIHEAHREYPIRLTATLGTEVPTIEEAVTSYHFAVMLLEQLMPMNRKSLLTAEDLDKSAGTGCYYPLDLEKNLIKSAVAQNEHEVKNILVTLVGRSEFDNMDRNSFYQFTYSMQSTIYRIVQQLGCSMEELFKDETPITMLMACRSKDEIAAVLDAIFARIFEVAGEKNSSLDHMLTETMLHFIHSSFDKDISLLDLAQHVKMSPNYISFIFKANVGQNFKDYLNTYRVRQAKQLIEEGDYTVNDIASRVGCNNTNTFIRIFKKEEGVSPGQYIAQRVRQIRVE